jgi:cytochrome-b5 reductase
MGENTKVRKCSRTLIQPIALLSDRSIYSLIFGVLQLFRFNLPKEDQVAGHTISSVILARVAKPGTENNWWPSYVYRPYTPVSAEGDVGHIDLVIKEYKGGKSSKYIHSLKPGDKIAAMGPFPLSQYHANDYESVGMIAAGSGITPMVMIIRCLFSRYSMIFMLNCFSSFNYFEKS